MEDDTSEINCSPKKRGRKKQLYKTILLQMEFYFSASNLSKDRWLNRKLEKEKAVHLTEFLKFNKIRSLTQDVNDLAKALKKSEIITVTEDMKVKRTQPVKHKENEDDYIIYIEQVPSDTDHEWLSSLFSKYGKIDYISVPKFKNSNKCKGFAFIEFSAVESAEKAIQDYKKDGNYLSTEIEPSHLISIATYEEPKLNEACNYEIDINDRIETLPVEDDMGTNGKDNAQKKRKNSDTSEELHKEKKHKTEESVEYKPESKNEESLEQNEVAVTDSEKDDGNVTGTEHEEGNGDEFKKKKNRNKKSKKKKNKDEIEHIGLQILSKRDWKRLRNKYLNMQKEKMKQLKKHIVLAKKKVESCRQNSAFRRNMKSTQEVDADKETEKNSFPLGLIVKVKFNEPVVEVKELKADMKKTNGLQFVDMKEGETVMHLRFESSEAALEFSKNSPWPQSKILEGEKEVQYWNKIQEQREEKLSRNVKKKERGKDKLMRKAENILGKHITFD